MTWNCRHNMGWMRRKLIRLASTMAAAALVITGAGMAEAAGLLVADGGFGGVLEIESHHVEVTINNGVAVTEVTQVFRNTENRQVEALYTFPVPKGASVADFSMWIGGKEMIGEVVEKKRAREIYESYKKTRRDPGLLEQTDYKTFEMRIFPIGPKAKQKVKIRYYQEVDCDNDWVTYVYPLSTVSRGAQDSRTRGTFSLNIHARSQVPIASMASPSHRDAFAIARHGQGYYEASLETSEGDLSRDVVLAYRLERPQTGVDMICSRDDKDGYFCLTLTAGNELADKNGPMDYVFVLDISGSMADEGKLAISRNCIEAFIGELAAQDRFEIMTFDVKPNPLFNKMTPATLDAKNTAERFLSSRQAGGGTVLRPALQTAYKYRHADRPLNVVILSDGMTEQREREQLLRAIADRPANAKVFCVGVGNEVNRPLLRQLADDAGGLAAFLSRRDNFSRQAKAFRRKLVRPALSNVRITFDGGGVYDVEPRRIPSLYHGAPVHLYGRYRRPGKAKVSLLAEINGAEFKRTMDVTFAARDNSNPEIERMWAWGRVQQLLRDKGAGGQASQTAISEVIRLGEAYSIVTEYTSFIVLENDAEYKRWRIDRRNLLLAKRDRGARDKLRADLERMRAESLAQIGPGAGGEGAETPDTLAPQPRTTWDAKPAFRLRPSIGGGPVGPATFLIIAGLAAVSVVANRKRRAAK